MSVKSQKSKQRNSEGYKIAVFNAYLLRRKIFLKILLFFPCFAAYHLEGFFSKVQKRALLAGYQLESLFCRHYTIRKFLSL